MSLRCSFGHGILEVTRLQRCATNTVVPDPTAPLQGSSEVHVFAAKTWRRLSFKRYQTESDPSVIRKISKIMKTSQGILVQKIVSFNMKRSTFSCQC